MMQEMGPRATESTERPSAGPPTGGYAHPDLARREPPLSELEFYGCHTRTMTLAEYEAYEGRIEFFDSGAGIACIANEAAHMPHERTLNMLGLLVDRIALVRGSPIVLCGALEIRRMLPSGLTRHIQPDQLIYLDPAALDRVGSQYLTAGEDEPKPDVVVEVDSTTDVRGSRLKLYEAWGFPEVWVEVPDAYAPSRRPGLQSGFRIYRAGGDRYVRVEESRAFPTWRAAEIHRGLNERVISEETSRVLTRVGRALGEREGTGPEDDPLLRQQRGEARAEGRADLVRALLASRGVMVPASFPSPRERDLVAGVSAEGAVTAASAAKSFADFLVRLTGPNA